MSFLLSSRYIKIPIYDTYDGNVNIVEGKTYVEISGLSPKEDTTIYIYKNRDEYLKEISDYTVKDNIIILQQELDEFGNGENVKVDVEQDQTTLLEMVFRRGGTSNAK